MDGSQGDIRTDNGPINLETRDDSKLGASGPADSVFFVPDPLDKGSRALENSAIAVGSEDKDVDGISSPAAVNKNISLTSPWLYGDEEEVDEITKAIREKVLRPQWEWLAAHFPGEKFEDLDARAKFLKDEKNQQAINQCFKDPEGKEILEQIELAGYNYVHDKFQNYFKTIEWQKTGPTEIKDPETGKPIITLEYSEIKFPPPTPSMIARKLDGTKVEIRGHREINGIKTSLEPAENVSAPVILSLDLMDENGEYLSKNDNPLRVTLHYNKRGELIEFSAPNPMQFNSKNPTERGYFEHKGKIITTGISQAKYQELLLAVEKNKGHAVNVSQVAQVPGPGIERQQQPKDVVSRLEGEQIDHSKGLSDKQVPGPIINEKLSNIMQATQDTQQLNDNVPGTVLKPVPPAPNKSIKEILVDMQKVSSDEQKLHQVLAAHNVAPQTEPELIAKQLASQSPEERRKTIARLNESGFSAPPEAQGKDAGHSGVSNAPDLKQQLQAEIQRRELKKYQGQDGKLIATQPAPDREKNSDPDSDKNPESKSAESSANNRIGGDTPKLANAKEHGATRQAGHGDSHQLAEQVRDKLEHQKQILSPLGDHSNKGMIEKDPEKKAKALWTDLAGKSLADQKDLINRYTNEELKNDVPHAERVKLLKELLKTVADARGKTLENKEGTVDKKELVEVRLKTEERQTTGDGFPARVGLYNEERKPVNTKKNVELLEFISQSIVDLPPNPLTHVTTRGSTAHNNVGKTRPQPGGRSAGH